MLILFKLWTYRGLTYLINTYSIYVLIYYIVLQEIFRALAILNK